MIDERMEEQACLYAAGALTETEAREFENAARGNAELRQLVTSLRDATGALAGTVPLLAPPAELKRKILSQLDEREKIVPLTAPSGWPNQPAVWLPWALAACLAVLCVVLVQRDSRLSDRVETLNRMAAELQNTTTDLQQTILALRETNRVDNLRIAMLGSLLTDEPKAAMVSLWDEDRQNGVIVGENLKPLPADKDYQLWVIDPQYKTPVDAGVFQVDAKGGVRVSFKAKQRIATANKFAVTQEAKGGSDVPKGTMVLISD